MTIRIIIRIAIIALTRITVQPQLEEARVTRLAGAHPIPTAHVAASRTPSDIASAGLLGDTCCCNARSLQRRRESSKENS